MTDAQRTRLYFPAWQRAFAAAWTLERGVIRPAGPPTEPTRRTEAVAGQLAHAAVRRVTPDDLRHACNALALQRAREYRARLPEGQGPLDLRPEAVSHTALDALALDLVLCWFRLLRDDTHLDSLIHWSHPENLERARLERALETRAVPGYVAQVCADRFGTSDFYSLTWESFRELFVLLKQRPHAWRAAAAPAAAPAPAHCPF